MHEEQVKRPLDDDELEAAVGGAAGAVTISPLKSLSEPMYLPYLPYLPGVELPPQGSNDTCREGLVHVGTVENLQHVEPTESPGSSFSSVGLGIIMSVQSSLI